MKKGYNEKKKEFERIIANLLGDEEFMHYFKTPDKGDFVIPTLGPQYTDLIYFGGVLNKEFYGNSKLLLLGYKIKKADVPDNITANKRTDDMGNYDPTTGNFHPSRKRIKEEYDNYYGIRQLVLCNKNLSHRGPKTDYELPENERVIKKLKRVPKANFYPLIDENTQLFSEEEKEKQEFLKEIWNKIPDDLKEMK